MRKKFITGRILIIGILAIVVASFAFAPASADGFTHGRVFIVDGQEYYMAGAPDAPGGAFDIPGHYWVQTGPNMVVGKHYNTGPFDLVPNWWSSDADDGALLFMVHGVFDTWSPEKAANYAARGFTHYHELLDVDTLEEHPTKVVWLKHTAVSFFNFDGGPMPQLGHEVFPGIDYEFMPNGFTPYDGGH